MDITISKAEKVDNLYEIRQNVFISCRSETVHFNGSCKKKNTMND